MGGWVSGWVSGRVGWGVRGTGAFGRINAVAAAVWMTVQGSMHGAAGHWAAHLGSIRFLGPLALFEEAHTGAREERAVLRRRVMARAAFQACYGRVL